MTLLNALTELIDVATESGAVERKSVARAVKVVQKKVDAMRVKAEKRSRPRTCPRCGAKCFGLTCYPCWVTVPAQMREAWELGKMSSEEDKIKAARTIVRWAHENPIDWNAP